MITLRFSLRRTERSGVASIWLLVVLAALTLLLAAVTWEHMTSRRVLDQRQKQLQSHWLANSGIELAADRLLSSPANYTSETITILPRSEVHITIQREPPSELLPIIGTRMVSLVGSPLGKALFFASTEPIADKVETNQVFRVTSEARYETGEPNVVVRTLTRRIRRITDGQRVRLESADVPAAKQ